MWPIDRPPHWVGRTQELAVLRAGAEALRRGEGGVVWVEGEPGIGKSSLVAEALAEAGDPEWDVGWGMADHLTEQLPLRLMLDCLQVRPGAPDPRRVHAADLLRNQRLGLFGGGDAAAGIEILVTLADELCAAAPTVLVVDDLQWADHASLMVWHQLAATIDQRRLLLIATCRRSGPAGGAAAPRGRCAPRWYGHHARAAGRTGRGGLGHDDARHAAGGCGAEAGYGVTALIAGRRDQRATADQILRRGLAVPVRTNSERENRDFLVAAHALALEQSGETRQAMLVLAGILPRRDGEMTLIHQWLPDLVRLAIAAGDRRMAQAATQACQAEAAAETPPARAAAASLRCRGLLRSDPGPLRDAVAHYRSAGPAVQLPAALEDLAAVLAKRSRPEEAKAALNEAAGLYEDLDARWDIRRADSRLRPYGIRRGGRGPRGPRATSGWEALTPTELKIAALIARGDSTLDIARGIFLSRRTVQSYISHILAKLGAKGRADIVREALRQGISP